MNDFERIKKFIIEDLRMSHVYQPVMLAELLSSGGKTNIESIAKQLLLQDRSQVEYYENITKNMVGKVLTRNRNITERLKNDYSLIGYESLSEEEVSKLIQYCESKIEVYIESRGGRIWAQRVAPDGDLQTTTQKMIDELLAVPPAALAMTRSMTSALGRSAPGMNMGWADADLQQWALTEEEYKETVRNYASKVGSKSE